MKISSIFYGLARKIGKIGSTLNDIETLATLNPKKIVKRAARKATWKAGTKATKKVSKFFK